jgi:ATP-dependent Lhr-like helicase
VLAGDDPPARLSRRARERLAALRELFAWVERNATSVVEREDDARWWTFAGLRANAQLADALGPLVAGARSRDNLSIQLMPGASAQQIDDRLASLLADPVASLAWPLDELASNLKFADCLPPDIAATVVARRAADPASVSEALREPMTVSSR